MITPTKEECIRMLEANNVPQNIIEHSKKVFEVAMKVADILEKKEINVNRDLIGAAALLHDIEKLKEDHENKGAELVKSMGFSEVALIIRKHGLSHLDDEQLVPSRIEDKLVFYADKRVKDDNIVSLEERFDYIKKKYGFANIDKEYDFAKKVEEELIGNKKIS